MSSTARPGIQAAPAACGMGDLRPPLAIVVMGVSGAGKSTLGTRLAAALGGRFIEGDQLHDSAAIEAMSAGRPLTDADRWPWLDRIASAMRDAVASTGIAVAACSALKHVYRQRLAATLGMTPRFVYLHAAADDLHRRLEQRPGHYMPASLLASQLATLEPPTDTECALTLPAADPVDRLCSTIVAWLEDAR